MHRDINHLVQLQELTLIREQEAFMKGDRLGELDDAIGGLREQLPPRIKTIFQKLQKIKAQVERMSAITQKLIGITRYETKDYVQGERIVDIEKSSTTFR